MVPGGIRDLLVTVSQNEFNKLVVLPLDPVGEYSLIHPRPIIEGVKEDLHDFETVGVRTKLHESGMHHVGIQGKLVLTEKVDETLHFVVH